MLFNPYFIWVMTLNIAHRLQLVDVLKISSAKHHPNLSAGAHDRTNSTSRTKKGKYYLKSKQVRRSKHANPIFTRNNSNIRVSRDSPKSSKVKDSNIDIPDQSRSEGKMHFLIP